MTGPGRRLERGPGPGDRLISAGLPDGFLVEGGRLGWYGATGLFVEEAGLLRWLPLGPVSEGRVTPEGWLLLLEGEASAEIALLGPQGSLAQGPLPGFAVEQVGLGAGQIVQRKAGLNRIEPLDDSPAPTLVLGAARGRLAAWTGPPGLSWVDGAVLYRQAQGGRTQTAGATRPGLSGLVAGAGGATVLLYEDAFAFAAPGARLVERPGAVEDLCLSPDGEQLLVDLGEDLLLLRTRDGAELRRWPGPRSLVGFNPAALSLDLSTGLIEDEVGATIHAGFRPWSAAAVGQRVYGPEGAAWCLQTGQPLWSHAGLEAEALVADAAQIIGLREGVLSRLHPDGHDLGGGPLPGVLVDDDALHLRALADGRLWWTGTGAAWSTDVDGGDLKEVDEARLPAERPAGATIQAGGRTWTWTADGLLLALQA